MVDDDVAYREYREDEPYSPDITPLWQIEPLRSKDGTVRPCGHRDCYRNAVRVVGYWAGNKHREFGDQTHDCCSVHSRAWTRGIV